MSPAETDRIQGVDEFLQRKLICGIGKESTQQQKNCYVEIKSFDDAHGEMKKMREGITRFISEGKDSLIVIRPESEPENAGDLRHDLSETMKLLYMIIAASQQLGLLGILENLKPHEIFDIPSPAGLREKILERLRNPAFREQLPRRWEQHLPPPAPEDLFNLLTMLDEGPPQEIRGQDHFSRLEMAVLGEVNKLLVTQSGNWVRFREVPHFGLVMTPALPDHPRWSPHPMVAFNSVGLVSRHSGTEKGREISRKAKQMAKNAGYPPYLYGELYPYQVKIRTNFVRTAEDLRALDHRADWEVFEEQEATINAEIDKERRQVFGE